MLGMRVLISVLLCAALPLASCNTTDMPAVSGTYNVQNIKAGAPGTDGEASVRIKLTTAGNVSEADLSSIVTFVKIVAKREATRQQAMLAQQRARAALAKMSPAQRAQVRYLAIETVRSAPNFQSQPAVFVEGPPPPAGAAPKFDRSVMLFDTQSETLVGNTVYDINRPPAVGLNAKFESFTARYIGTGM